MEKQLILIVDDNAQNLYLSRFLLERQGYAICEAQNGEQAIAAVQTEAPALVLMDIQMPGMDGLEATQHIKAVAEAPLVIALTAKVMTGDREAILAAGCDGYIQKPINLESFVATVETYLLSAERGAQ